MNIEQFYAALWADYIEVTPQARQIHALFSTRGEVVVNDHVAFRTFSDSPIALDKLEPLLIDLGYRVYDDYGFTANKLLARSYNNADARVPKVFVSELQRHQLSAMAQPILADLIRQFDQVAEVNALLKASGFAINGVSGEVKGTPAVCLEQSSTLADKVSIRFAGGEQQRVPSCFYEFAKRYPGADNQLFQGFVADNADKIFSSTNAA